MGGKARKTINLSTCASWLQRQYLCKSLIVGILCLKRLGNIFLILINCLWNLTVAQEPPGEKQTWPCPVKKMFILWKRKTSKFNSLGLNNLFEGTVH
jgi:hypothetical protein